MSEKRYDMGTRARNEAKIRRGASLRFVSDEARRSEASFSESRTRRGEAEVSRGEAKRFEKCYLDLFKDIHFFVGNSKFCGIFLIFLPKKCDMRHVLISA